MGLGFAAFGAELPELEARCHEHLYYARPTVLAATEDPQGTQVNNLLPRAWLLHADSSLTLTRARTTYVILMAPMFSSLSRLTRVLSAAFASSYGERSR